MDDVTLERTCEKCNLPQGETRTETVTGVGYGWKCTCNWWNWTAKLVPDPETTVCSSMFCYNRAEINANPVLPPFCEDCKSKQKKVFTK